MQPNHSLNGIKYGRTFTLNNNFQSGDLFGEPKTSSKWVHRIAAKATSLYPMSSVKI